MLDDVGSAGALRQHVVPEVAHLLYIILMQLALGQPVVAVRDHLVQDVAQPERVAAWLEVLPVIPATRIYFKLTGFINQNQIKIWPKNCFELATICY